MQIYLVEWTVSGFIPVEATSPEHARTLARPAVAAELRDISQHDAELGTPRDRRAALAERSDVHQPDACPTEKGRIAPMKDTDPIIDTPLGRKRQSFVVRCLDTHNDLTHALAMAEYVLAGHPDRTPDWDSLRRSAYAAVQAALRKAQVYPIQIPPE